MTRLLFFIAPSVLWFLPAALFAAPSLTVSPLVIDEELEARDIITRTITLTNTGTQPLTIYPSVNNILLDEGGKIESFSPPSMSDRTSSLASWIEIPRKGIKLPVGESRTVDMTLRINPFPEPGEYHAALGFGWGNNTNIAKQLVAEGRAPRVVVTVTIDDDRTESLKLSKFIIDRFITKGGNQGATYSVTNPGDVPLVPTGEIIFYNNRGEEVSSFIVNEGGEQLEPGEEREFKTNVPVDGLFGKYKALLTVEYGNSQLASVNDISFFYVFPLKTLLIILGILFAITIVIALYFHKRYMDEGEIDDSDFVPLRVRESRSEAKDHDVDLKIVDNGTKSEKVVISKDPILGDKIGGDKEKSNRVNAKEATKGSGKGKVRKKAAKKAVNGKSTKKTTKKRETTKKTGPDAQSELSEK